MKGPLQILCVEDNDSDFMLIERELRRLPEPFNLVRVIKRAEYEDRVIAARPDVILCDHNLPGFSSFEAFRFIKQRNLRIPFILVTATIGENEGVQQVSEGIDDYILKDRLRRLPSAITRAVKFARSESERENYFNEIIRGERRFRALIENSTEAVVLCNEHLLVTYISPSFPRIFHPPAHGIRGKSVLSLASPSHESLFYNSCRQALENPGTPVQVLFQTNGTSGSLWIECVINDLTGDEHVKAIVFNLRNVTPRVNSQESLHRTQAILSAIIENSRIGYVLIDPYFRVVAFNKEAEGRYTQEFGQDLRENAYLFDYLPEGEREAKKALYDEVLAGETIGYEISFRQHNGYTTWYDVQAFPVHNSDHSMLGFVIATEDISERKVAEKEKDALTEDLLAKNKNLEQFSLIISHNLRAPVATMLGLARLLKADAKLSEKETEQSIEGIWQNAAKIDQVIIDLNTILQRQRGHSEGKTNVNLEELLSEVVELLEGPISESGMQIQTDLQVPHYCGIKTYLHSIFLNLISNAVRYRRPGEVPKLTIVSKLENDDLVLVFSDNGLGIDLSMHGDKVFGLYKKFHLHSDGRGMGLYMVKTQALLMGGSVTIESEVGRGSVFTVRLPYRAT